MTTLLNEGRIRVEPDMAIDRLCRVISRKDHCFIPARKMQSYLSEGSGPSPKDALVFQESWNDLPCDEYMADGGRYRSRRHATLRALPSSHIVYVETHRPHYQSLVYNHLNGNVARHFEPIRPQILGSVTMMAILRLCCDIFGRLSPYSHWHIEIHQFRIDAKPNVEGKPTPEGMHRDGVDFVFMMMVKRTNVINGCTHIYDLDKKRINFFTLTDMFDTAIVNDQQVLHDVTPVIQSDIDRAASRDVLVVTFRKK
jgi:hypothetical protein